MKPKKVAQGALLSLLSLAVFLAVAEGATRLFWKVETEPAQVDIVPAGSNRTVVQQGITYETNSLGIRDREPSDLPPPGSRVLGLGDSFLWGSGLAPDQLITTKLERLLRSEHPDAAVINAGVPGANTADEYDQLLRLAGAYRPRSVVVFFFTNDVLERETLAGGEQLEVSKRQRVKEWLRTRSKFMAMLYYLYKTKYAATFGVPKGVLPPEYFNLNDDNAGWRAFKQATLAIRDWCRGEDVELLFVIIPSLTCLNERYPYEDLRQSVRSFLDESGVRYVDLFDVFAEYEPEDLWVSPENAHWNDLATSAAAAEIAPLLLN